MSLPLASGFSPSARPVPCTVPTAVSTRSKSRGLLFSQRRHLLDLQFATRLAYLEARFNAFVQHTMGLSPQVVLTPPDSWVPASPCKTLTPQEAMELCRIAGEYQRICALCAVQRIQAAAAIASGDAKETIAIHKRQVDATKNYAKEGLEEKSQSRNSSSSAPLADLLSTILLEQKALLEIPILSLGTVGFWGERHSDPESAALVYRYASQLYQRNEDVDLQEASTKRRRINCFASGSSTNTNSMKDSVSPSAGKKVCATETMKENYTTSPMLSASLSPEISSCNTDSTSSPTLRTSEKIDIESIDLKLSSQVQPVNDQNHSSVTIPNTFQESSTSQVPPQSYRSPQTLPLLPQPSPVFQNQPMALDHRSPKPLHLSPNNSHSLPHFSLQPNISCLTSSEAFATCISRSANPPPCLHAQTSFTPAPSIDFQQVALPPCMDSSPPTCAVLMQAVQHPQLIPNSQPSHFSPPLVPQSLPTHSIELPLSQHLQHTADIEATIKSSECDQTPQVFALQQLVQQPTVTSYQQHHKHPDVTDNIEQRIPASHHPPS